MSNLVRKEGKERGREERGREGEGEKREKREKRIINKIVIF
jgi:hypothetical protein